MLYIYIIYRLDLVKKARPAWSDLGRSARCMSPNRVSANLLPSACVINIVETTGLGLASTVFLRVYFPSDYIWLYLTIIYYYRNVSTKNNVKSSIILYNSYHRITDQLYMIYMWSFSKTAKIRPFLVLIPQFKVPPYDKWLKLAELFNNSELHAHHSDIACRASMLHPSAGRQSPRSCPGARCQVWMISGSRQETESKENNTYQPPRKKDGQILEEYITLVGLCSLSWGLRQTINDHPNML